jgi:hypothetical protein
MEQPYTNRELEQKFDDVHEKLDGQNVILDKILTQALKTNGRVNELENWKSYSSGALKIVQVLLLPIVGWALYQILTLIRK